MAPAGVILLTLLLMALVLQMFSSEGRPPRPVVVATGEWEPFVGADLPSYGPLTRLVEAALTRAGYDPLFHFGSWQEAQNNAATGEVLAAFPFVETTERRQRFHFSDPLHTFRYVLFYKRPAFRKDGADLALIAGPEDLSRYRVGLVEGYQLWGELADTVEVAETYADLGQAFEALSSGDIDLLGEGRIAGELFLNRPEVSLDASQFDAIEAAESWLPSSRQQLYLIAERSPRGESFIQQFDRALAEVRSSSGYAGIAEALARAEGWRRADRVTLSSAPVAAKDPRSGSWVLLPRGTRATVLEWPPDFLGGHAQPPPLAAPRWCRVKILNGPQRGRILMVEAERVELVPWEMP